MSSHLITLLASLALAVACLSGCATETSPGEPTATPPPPPSRTPTGLRHAPNPGVQPMSDEMDEEKAAELLGAQPPAEEEAAEGEDPAGGDADSE